MSENTTLYETLAHHQHEAWADWMCYLIEDCATHNPDDSITIPAGQVEGWRRQIGTKYADLSEREKDSDREQVDRFWHLVTTEKPHPIEQEKA